MRKFIKENWEEFTIGFILGLGFFLVIGCSAVLLGLVTGVLWRLGGMGLWGTKAWRRIGISVLLVGAVWSLPLLMRMGSSLVTLGLLKIGYGQRDVNDPIGSPLGNWWLDTLNQIGVGAKAAKWCARATIVIGVWVIWFIALRF